MFKGVSQCMHIVGVLYFSQFSPFEYSNLPLYLPCHVFQQFLIHILISCKFTSYGMLYYWCFIILFSFPSFPEFHRVDRLLQTCSISEFVYVHACFCTYVYLWICLLFMRENMHLLCFWSCLISLSIIFSSWIHSTSNLMSLSLWMSRTPLCVCTTISWSIQQL
jgi:hypothetical protein